MPNRIVPFTREFEPAVRALNERLRAGGSDWEFPETSSRDRSDTTDAYYFEDFLVVDDDGNVRGGYILKHQDFSIDQDVTPMANYTLPVSEGIVDRKFGMIGVSMILDAQKREAFLFDLGLGSMEAPSARVMKGVGWSLTPVPFLFRVIRPSNFLRQIRYARSSTTRRLLLDTLAFTGLGWLGNAVVSVVKRHVPAAIKSLAVECVAEFGSWADEIWEAGRRDYHFTAVRDAETLNALYPPSDARYHRLKVSLGGVPVGWALVLNTTMDGHKQFGDMKVGSIADCFAPMQSALAVAYGADRFLSGGGVDLIVSNQSNAAWCAALRKIGYLDGPSNFILTTSKRLSQLIGPLEEVLSTSHFNRGDGDGPIHL